MNQDNYYKIRISPEVIRDDVFQVNVSGMTIPIYSSMTEILSGGTAGTSLLTGLTLPILFTQTIHDIGYYSPFDGNILQEQTIANFVYSATSGFSQWTYIVTNSSDLTQKKYLDQSVFYIDWGDSSSIQSFNIFSPITLSHTYPSVQNTYTISISGDSPWGITIVNKTIHVPFTGMTIDNPQGNTIFIPYDGIWTGDPTNYNYIFSGDAVNQISAQTSNNYTTIPFLVTGVTTSSLTDLKLYGSVPYIVGQQVTGTTGSIGIYLGVVNLPNGSSYTAYTIDNILFYDYPNGQTFFSILSSGITSNMIVEVPIVKEEALMGIVMEPEVQSNIYIERGKNTALERIQRLGEIDNMGDLEKYGYSFFNLKTYN